ncbi:MAG: DUF2911 domain-containing protein [Chthoniobacterales bacterium]
MNKTIASLLLLPALLAATPLLAQEHQRVSPHETVEATIAGNEMSVVYGRPYTKDPKSGEKRKIWGTLVPYGKIWRMGADEATLFTTQQTIEMGGTTIPAGTYSLYLLPEENGDAKLIVNKQTGQWGTKYEETQDLARISMKKETNTSAPDQFTIAITETDAAGSLKLMWDDRQYSVAFHAKS